MFRRILRWLRINLIYLAANITKLEVPHISQWAEARDVPAKDIVCYVSGPISRGSRAANLRQSEEAHSVLMQNGITVINPMLTMLLRFAFDKEYPHTLWLSQDLVVIERCDCVLRLPGDSKGADMEVEHAHHIGLPVFYNLEALLDWAEIRYVRLQSIR